MGCGCSRSLGAWCGETCGCPCCRPDVSGAGVAPRAHQRNRKVAAFENGEPNVTYHDLYGCFLEEEVSASDSDSDDSDDGSDTTRRRRRRERRRHRHPTAEREARRKRIAKNQKALPGKLYRLVQIDKAAEAEERAKMMKAAEQERDEEARQRQPDDDGEAEGETSRRRNASRAVAARSPSSAGGRSTTTRQPHPPQKWFFYNDTLEYNMVVTGYFGPMNDLVAHGKTRMWREMPSGLLIAELVIEPLETAAYVEGRMVDGFDLRFKALPKGERRGRRRGRRHHSRRSSDGEESEDESA